MDNSLLPALGITAFGLLLLVTGSVVYLTLVGWRDRRRQELDRKIRR